MKKIIALLALIVFALGLLALRKYIQREEADGPAATQQRDIYIISASGLRHSHLTSYLYQHSQTPAIDFLAYDGVRCLTAFSTATDAFSAHLSILTGLYPYKTALARLVERDLLLEQTPAAEELTTLPALLKQNNYRTAAFLADPELRNSPFFIRQFDLVAYSQGERYAWETGLSNADVVRLSTGWIRQNRNHPVLLLLNFAEPTAPFLPEPPYDRHYRDHPYDGEVASIDEQIGKFVNFLKKEGRYERSIIVLVSPYGETLDSQSRFVTVAHDNVRIPMTFTAPGLLPAHLEYSTTASLVDVAPSIATMLNLQLPHEADGQALFRQGTDEEIERDTVFGKHIWPSVLRAQPEYFVFSRGKFFSSAQENPEAAMELLRRELNTRPSPSADNGTGRAVADDLRNLENARVAAKEKKYEEAAKFLNSVGEEKKRHPYLLQFLADLESARADHARAAAILEAAPAATQDPRLMLLLAREWARAGKTKEAAGLIDRLPENYQLSYYDHSIISYVLLRSGDAAGAVSRARRAIKENPYWSHAYLLLADARQQSGDLKGAEQSLKQALQIGGNDTAARKSLSALLLKMGREAEAIAYLRQAVGEEDRR